MNLQLEAEYSKADVLNEIAQLKAQIDAKRPLPDDIEGRVMQKLRLEWNYNSNAIEGNRLNYGETVALLMHGITAKGKPLKDHLDIQGHNEAINFLLKVVKEDRPFTESDIRALHKLILVEPYSVAAQTADGQSTTKMIKLGEYKTLPNHVQTITGEIHYYISPQDVPVKMGELMEWYAEVFSTPEIHPIVTAALFHHKFVAIHPFDDGNGRLSRILMNLILMKNGYPPAVIKMEDRQNYYSLLSQADIGETWPFVEYIADRLKSSLNLYVKAINGEDIDEDEDIDKEIALLKIELQGNVVTAERRSNELIVDVFLSEILPLSLKIVKKIKSFGSYFFKSSHWFVFYQESTEPIFDIVSEDRWLDGIPASSLDKFNNVHLIRIESLFEGYKNPDNNFDLTLATEVNFGDFYYSISVRGILLVKKLYHEKISTKEQSNILKAIIQVFKEDFRRRIEDNPLKG